MNAQWIDFSLLLLLLGSVWRGWRRGLVTTVASVAGLIAGGILGSRIAAWLLPILGLPEVARVPFSIALVIAAAVTASSAAGLVGHRIRKSMSWRPVRWCDSLGGAGLDAAALLIIVWMVAATVSVVPTPLGSSVRQSRAVQSLDAAMPDAMDAALAQLVKVLDNSGAPRVFFSLGGLRNWDESPADPTTVSDPQVRAAARSVLRVSGSSAGCAGVIVGSGFVFAPNRVMTNAHVVAGMREVDVRDVSGVVRRGEVVHFDPRVDVAVLRVSTQGWPVLAIASTPERGQSAAAIGYPGGGSQKTVSAVVAEVFTARGSDIYGGGAVTRSVVALHSDIRQGDSGGALIDLDGRVRGVVFAVSQDEPNLGYALAPEAISRAAQQGAKATQLVATGRCARGE